MKYLLCLPSGLPFTKYWRCWLISLSHQIWSQNANLRALYRIAVTLQENLLSSQQTRLLCIVIRGGITMAIDAACTAIVMRSLKWYCISPAFIRRVYVFVFVFLTVLKSWRRHSETVYFQSVLTRKSCFVTTNQSN